MMSVIQEKFLCKTNEKLNIREKLKANCTPSSKKNDNSKKPAPLIAKPSPDVNIKLNVGSEVGVNEENPINGNSGFSLIGDYGLFPKGPSKRPTSPPIRNIRGRHSHRAFQESLRRTPSPGRCQDQKTIDAVKKRIKHALTMRLYVFPRRVPHLFLVSGEKPDQKFKVKIGPQICSCGKGPHCVHILFVMLKVLKVPKNDSRLYSSSLKNYEVETLFTNYEEQKDKVFSSKKLVPIKKSFHSSSDYLLIHPDEEIAIPSRPSSMPDIRGNPEDEEECRICLYEMKSKDDIVVCKLGCKKQFHQHCIMIWTEYCKREKEPVICPLCRSIWPVNITEKNPNHLHTCSETPLLSTSETNSLLSSSPTFQNTSQNSSSAKSCGDDDALSNSILPHSHTCVEISDRLKDGNEKSTKNSTTNFTISSLKHLHYLSQKEEKIEEWTKIFGKETVKCLFSSDWISRENALKRLYAEVTSILFQLAYEESPTSAMKPKRSSIIICICCDILSVMVMDPVYKVYIACLRCFRGLLQYTVCVNNEERLKLQIYATPLIKNILNKCADGNRRIRQLSLASLVEICKGSSGEFAVGRQIQQPASIGLGGISYLLNSIVEHNDEMTNWQWYLGCLYALDKLIQEFPSKFYLLCVQMYSKDIRCNITESCGYKLTHLDRLISVLKFAIRLINHCHLTVRKMAHRVFVLAARLTSHIPSVFYKVCDLLSNVDSHLEVRLKEKVQTSTQNFHFLSDLLSQVEKTSKDDETVIYTSLRTSENYGRLGKNFPNSQVHLPDKMLILEKLGHDLPHSDCSCFKSKHQNFQHCCYNCISKTQSNYNQFINEKQKEMNLNRCNVLPLFEKCNVQISNRIHRLDVAEALQDKAKNFRHGAPEKLRTFSSYYNTPKQRCHRSNNSVASTRSLHSPVPHRRHTMNLPYLPPNDSHHCPVGDLIDLYDSPLPNNVKSSEDISPKEESNIGPMNGEIPNQVECSAVNTNEALTLLEMLTQNSVGKTLPSVPGLTDAALELYESQDVLFGMNFFQDKSTNSYLEDVHWKRGHLLGTGAFSSCYQARDITTGTIMAVKQVSFCRNSVEEQENQMLAIRDEIILMLKLDHPNIVRMLGATLQENHYNMFVEWMPGGSVSTLLTHYGPFTEIVILRYIQQVLSGLAYLHNNQILHRDLKGANLLVDSTGHHLRIGDFGAAARLASQRTIANEFKGQLLGTIAFMAPEVLRGEDYGRSCDVWSVGCIIIEMATTKPPWDAVNASNDLALLYKIACSSGPPPIPNDLPKFVQAIALKCLEPRSEDRLTAKELLQLYFISHR